MYITGHSQISYSVWLPSFGAACVPLDAASHTELIGVPHAEKTRHPRLDRGKAVGDQRWRFHLPIELMAPQIYLIPRAVPSMRSLSLLSGVKGPNMETTCLTPPITLMVKLLNNYQALTCPW